MSWLDYLNNTNQGATSIPDYSFGTQSVPNTGSMQSGTNWLTNMWNSPNAFQNMGYGLQGLGSIYGAYTGGKQLGLARKQLAHDQAYAATNLSNQATLINGQMRDRQIARLGAEGINANATSPEILAYMAQNQVKGKI